MVDNSEDARSLTELAFADGLRDIRSSVHEIQSHIDLLPSTESDDSIDSTYVYKDISYRSLETQLRYPCRIHDALMSDVWPIS